MSDQFPPPDWFLRQNPWAPWMPSTAPTATGIADAANQRRKSRRFPFIPSRWLQLGGDAQWRTARGAPERRGRRLGRDTKRWAARISKAARESLLDALDHSGASRLRQVLGGCAIARERGANAGQRSHSLASAASAELGAGADARDRWRDTDFCGAAEPTQCVDVWRSRLVFETSSDGRRVHATDGS